jgi:DNA-binding transcriptional LysR family regulator
MGRLTQMAVFAAVVDAGGFTAAAHELGLAKSTVSRHIAELEERLGVRLLQRTTRRMQPTELGRAYYERCVQVVADAEEADRLVTERLPTPKGRLVVGSAPEFASRYLVGPLTSFLEAFPEVEVELRLADRLVDLIDEGLDVSIRIAPMTDSSFVARQLGPSRSYFVASPRYLERHGTPKEFGDLADHRGVGHPLFPYRNLSLTGPGGQVRQVRLGSHLTANDGEAVVSALVAGAGIGWLPDWLAKPYLRDGSLVTLLTEWTEPPRTVHALYPHRRHLSAKVRAFLDHLLDSFGDPPPWSL